MLSQYISWVRLFHTPTPLGLLGFGVVGGWGVAMPIGVPVPPGGGVAACSANGFPALLQGMEQGRGVLNVLTYSTEEDRAAEQGIITIRIRLFNIYRTFKYILNPIYMCFNIYIYVCVYTYISFYIFKNILHLPIYIKSYITIYTYRCIYIQIQMGIDIQIWLHIYIQIQMHRYIDMMRAAQIKQPGLPALALFTNISQVLEYIYLTKG